jgi:hypothetical protein
MIQVPRQAPCLAGNLLLPLPLPLSLMVFLSSLSQINKKIFEKETKKNKATRREISHVEEFQTICADIPP